MSRTASPPTPSTIAPVQPEAGEFRVPRARHDKRGWVGELLHMSKVSPEVWRLLLDELEHKCHLSYDDYLYARELLLAQFRGNSAALDERLTDHAYTWLCAQLYGEMSSYTPLEEGSESSHASNSVDFSQEIYRARNTETRMLRSDANGAPNERRER